MVLYSKVKRKWLNFLKKVTTIIQKIPLKINGVKYGSKLKIGGSLKIYNTGTIELGDNVTINSALWANPISAAMKSCFQVQGTLIIGDGTGISNTSITCQKEIVIGNHVLIGANCQIFDTDFHPLQSKYRFGPMKNNDFTKNAAIIIEDGVFIGTGCIILKGTHIGSGAIIGAGSVVCGHIPENEIWAGSPARYIKKTTN